MPAETPAGFGAQVQGARPRFLLRRLIQIALLKHQGQRQVAPAFRPFRMPPRIVERRALDHAHQQGKLVRAQLLQGFGEIKLRGRAEAVDAAPPLLPQINLVDVGGQDRLLVVTPFQ